MLKARRTWDEWVFVGKNLRRKATAGGLELSGAFPPNLGSRNSEATGSP